MFLIRENIHKEGSFCLKFIRMEKRKRLELGSLSHHVFPAQVAKISLKKSSKGSCSKNGACLYYIIKSLDFCTGKCCVDMFNVHFICLSFSKSNLMIKNMFKKKYVLLYKHVIFVCLYLT